MGVLAGLTVVLAAWAGALTLGVGREGPEEASPGSAPAAIVEPKQGPFRGNPLPEGIAGTEAPAFRLADARGREIDTKALRGRPYAVTFLYTDCRDTCPLIAAELGKALELLGPRASRVAVLAVTADPKSDTPGAVRTWLERHRLPENFRYLIGSEGKLRPVWDAYYVVPQRHGDPKSTHSASIWLIDARGRLRTKFSAGFPVHPPDIAHDLGILLDEAERERR